jgi:hypothetical protein
MHNPISTPTQPTRKKTQIKPDDEQDTVTEKASHSKVAQLRRQQVRAQSIHGDVELSNGRQQERNQG